MKICLYGICKDELKFIDRCFDSIKDADYIVLLDTGSSDGTFEKLKSLERENPNKYRFDQKIIKPWRFDTARNEAMRLIPEDTDVCISVDMDDVFPSNWRQIIEEDINDGYNKVLGRYQYYNEDGSEKDLTLLDRVHLYNDAHWENGIHERLVCNSETREISDSRFVVLHKQDFSKNRRESYLEAAKNSSQDNLYGQLCYGYETYNSNDYDTSISVFEDLYNKLKDTDSDLLTRKWIFEELADMYAKRNEKDKEFECYKRCLKINAYGSKFEDYFLYDGRVETKYEELKREMEKVNMTEQEITAKKYADLARKALEDKDYVLAISYADTAAVIDKTEENKSLRETCDNLFHKDIESRTYTENKVAIYAITKNEMKFVDKWYENLSPEADYICVLDTGSTDGSYERFLEIAAKDPRVIVKQQTFSPWRFDTPRNVAMSLIPKDANILFSIDLDEVLEPGWGKELRDNWKQGLHQRGDYQYAWSHNPSGAPGRVFWYNKIHAWGWLWRYPVHELLYSTYTNSENYFYEQELKLNVVYLHHYPDPTKSRGTYLPLLQQRVKEYDAEFCGFLYLAHEYNYRGQYQNSIDMIHQIFERFDAYKKDLTYGSCYLFMGEDYMHLGDLKNAEISFKEGIEKFPDYRELYLGLAQVYLDTNRHKEAVDIIQQGLKNSVRHFSWVERDISWTYQPFDLLCLAYFYSGDKVKSLACAYKATVIEPTIQRLQDNVNAVMNAIEPSEW